MAPPLQLPPYQPEPLPSPAVYYPKPVVSYEAHPKPPPNYLPAKPLPSYHSNKPTPTYLPTKPSPIYQPVKEEPKPYSYEYGVHNDYSGVHYNAGQVADGSGTSSKFIISVSLRTIAGNVEGSYTVALPDGRIQHVTYHADHYNGFVAEVHYEGEAHYDPAPAPYHAPKHQIPPKPVPHVPTPTLSYHPRPTYQPNSLPF